MPAITVPTAFQLAVQHQRAGRLAEAEALYRQILAVEPTHAAACSNLAEACRVMNRLEEAVALLQRAIQLQPNFAEARYNLGVALVALGRPVGAEEAFHQALALKPEYAEACNNLGNLLKDQFRWAEAEAAYRQALEIRPGHAEAQNNLGNLLNAQGHPESALDHLHRALELNSDFADAHSNLGSTFMELGQFDEADASLGRALALSPHHPDAAFNLAFLHLLRGDYERGWTGYEARWEAGRRARPSFAQPKWDGAPLEARRILIHAEQGFGDSLQFIRYGRLVAERGGQVIVLAPPALARLLRTAPGVPQVVTTHEAVPPFDVHVPMLDLPRIFATSPATIPCETPYLSADASGVAAWRQRLGGARARWRVGLAWAGDPHHRRNHLRNLPFELLLPLLRVPDCQFFSLQIGTEAATWRRFPEASAIVDHTASLTDFADTAAFLHELDLVICVDTAVAHLAGALGQRVWTLLSFVPDWRWSLESAETPWYPTMRLFRQPNRGNWRAVIRRVENELAALAAAPRLD
jgi:Flp pilus assembly protein TadD